MAWSQATSSLSQPFFEKVKFEKNETLKAFFKIQTDFLLSGSAAILTLEVEANQGTRPLRFRSQKQSSALWYAQHCCSGKAMLNEEVPR